MAIEAEISESRFFKMTPAAIKREIEAFFKRQKNKWERAEYQSWLTGLYVMNSIGCCFSRRNKYPPNPMEQQKINTEELELTEEQKEYYRQKFVERLQRMEKRFNTAKEKSAEIAQKK